MQCKEKMTPCFRAASYCSPQDKSTSPPSPVYPSPGLISWTICHLQYFLKSCLNMYSTHFIPIQIDIARMVESLVDAGIIVAGRVVVPVRGWKYITPKTDFENSWWFLLDPGVPGNLWVQVYSESGFADLGKPQHKKISVHLGIARLGGGLNPCQDGLWHLFLGEMSM